MNKICRIKENELFLKEEDNKTFSFKDVIR